jgi:hypothetical protein
MFKFARHEFTNELTKKIEADPNISLETVLFDPELSSALRNEAAALLSYLTATHTPPGTDKEQPRFHSLADLALKKPEIPPETYTLFQLHQNATTVLSSPVNKLAAMFRDDPTHYVTQSLQDFLSSESRHDRRFAGHFARITERMLRCPDCWPGETFDTFRRALSVFLIDHVNILAYQQLIVQVGLSAEEGSELFTPQSFLVSIVKAAARWIVASRPVESIGSELMEAACRRAAQPSNKHQAWSFASGGKEKLPIPEWDRNNDRAVLPPIPASDLEFIADDIGTLPEMASDGEEARERAYLLLSSIRYMYTESLSLTGDLQAVDVMRGLLICGVYADPNSLVASQAFGLLKIALYDEPPNRDTPFPSEPIEQLIKEYAAAFEFTTNLTAQMIAAFPIFYGHAYTKIKDGFGKHGKVGTPLSLYRVFLLDDPPLNDKLSWGIFKALERSNDEAKKIRELLLALPDPEKGWNQTKEYRKLRRFHRIYWEFCWNGKPVEEALPLPGKADADDPTPSGVRAAINGFPSELARLMRESRAFEYTLKRWDDELSQTRRPATVLFLIEDHLEDHDAIQTLFSGSDDSFG